MTSITKIISQAFEKDEGHVHVDIKLSLIRILILLVLGWDSFF